MQLIGMLASPYVRRVAISLNDALLNEFHILDVLEAAHGIRLNPQFVLAQLEQPEIVPPLRLLLAPVVVEQIRHQVAIAPFGAEQLDASYAQMKEVRAIGRGVGLWGDMVIVLNDGAKIEIRCIDRCAARERGPVAPLRCL